MVKTLALEELNTFLGLPAMIWFFVAIAVAVGFVILIAVHETFIMTKFAKKARSMKRHKGLPALIQDNNVVRLYFSDGSLPEGLFHIAKSWFVRPRKPFLPRNNKEQKSHVGAPTKEESLSKMDVLKPGERAALEEIMKCPILEDTGKPIFIGSMGQPMLVNFSTVAHADVTDIQEVLPIVYPPTIIDALHEYSEKVGYLRGNREQMKLIYLAIVAAMVIGPLGLIVYLLTQRPTAGITLLMGVVGLFH